MDRHGISHQADVMASSDGSKVDFRHVSGKKLGSWDKTTKDITVNIDTSREMDMPLTTNERQAIIDDLTTNCDCWADAGDDEVLANFSDDKLLRVKEVADRESQLAQVANAAVAGFDDGKGSLYRLNPETGQWETAPARTDNAGAGKKMMPDDEEDEDEEDEDEINFLPKRIRNKRRAQTVEELLQQASPVLRDQITNRLSQAGEIEEREKEKHIRVLLANVADVDRPAQRDWLRNKSLGDLEQMSRLIARGSEPDEEGQQRQGGGGRRTDNSWAGSQAMPGFDGSALDDDDVLRLPGPAWGPVGNERKGDGDRPVGNFNPDNAANIQEYIRSAPPEVQAILRHANAIEGQKRQELIARLTENVADEDDAQRLAATLKNRPVGELEILVNALVSAGRSKPVSRPSGLYAGSPPLTNRGGGDDDVLPTPKWDWSEGGNGVAAGKRTG